MDYSKFTKIEDFEYDKEMIILANFHRMSNYGKGIEDDFRYFHMSDKSDFKLFEFLDIISCYDITLMYQAVDDYYEEFKMSDGPVLDRTYFIERCIYKRDDSYNKKYYQPLLRLKKMERILE